MRLLPGVHLVGSGSLGHSITDPHDSHVYLIDGGSDAVLIDAGCGLATDDIIARIIAAGVEPTSVSRVLLTHAHADHAAGARFLADALGAEILASARVAEIVAAGDEFASGLSRARAAGTYPEEVVLTPTHCGVLLDNDDIRVGGLVITALATPGHADGHLCFRVTIGPLMAVFTGDLVFARGRVALLSTEDSRPAVLAESIRRLAKVRPDVLLPGHGSFVLSRAGDHLRMALDAFDTGRVPPQLVP
ncbi:unannotated protein [freshwater metagenome]|uniref:Unannotated protein n=1 Tax=freshwater metagenome TaxID=449393 RepID=A0A6J7QTE8_9ZZZZ|nr:MBL fold metallo-hydrolase [Actinomycetota bacterium]MSW35713.1 MBL fold metallo-hydrolase [Actinomycetota bacterium]MSX39098.1 MBL fold metallo-hydrolase [Actinomycetota bacterium]